MHRALAAVALLAVTASLASVATATPGCSTPGTVPVSADGGTWSGDVPDNATGGRVRVLGRTLPTTVTTWNRSRYEVQAPTGSYVDARTGGSVWNLTVEVRRSEALLPAISSNDEEATPVEVRVPALDYDRVDVEADPGPQAGAVAVDGLDGTRLDVDTGGGVVRVADGAFRDLDLDSRGGDVTVVGARIRDAYLRASRGDVCVVGLDGRRVDVAVDGGSFSARDLHARTVEADVTRGDVDVRLSPVGTGNVTLTAHDGDAALDVPVRPDRGYDVGLQAPGGRIRHDLPGTHVVDEGQGYLRLRTDGYADRSNRTGVEMSAGDGEAAIRGEAPPKVPAPGEGRDAAETVGILAAVAAALYLAASKLGLIGSGLYSRIGRDDVLDHATRRRIRDLVEDEPGIHFREIQRRLDVGRGILEHHLDRLVDTDVLVCKESQGYRCYFVVGDVDRDLMTVVGSLRSETARAVLRAVRDAADPSVTDVARAADVPSSTASYHLGRLDEAGLIDKERVGRRRSVTLTSLGRRAVEAFRLG